MFPRYVQYLSMDFYQTFVIPPPLVVRPCRCPPVRACVRASLRPSMIHVVVLCFRDSSSICWRIFAILLSLVHLGTEMNWLDFGVKSSKFKVTAWPNASQIFMFPLYLQYLLLDFRQTFFTGASWDTLPGYVFGSKGQSSGSHHRGGGAEHSTLPSSATFSSSLLTCILVHRPGPEFFTGRQHCSANDYWSRR